MDLEHYFFQCFWKQLGPFVVRALNDALKDGELSATQKESVIIYIPKGDKPREYIKNWRPISLLNVIYKIGSSCIANIIFFKVLPTLIDDDQTGFISNRYRGDNIRLINDLINYLNQKGLPGLLLCLDFEKAFDSLDWQFMFKVLKSFGFGNDGTVSGLFMNADKIQAIWVGSKKHPKAKYMPHLKIIWNPRIFKFFGIWQRPFTKI